jgi:hypothetical protein
VQVRVTISGCELPQRQTNSFEAGGNDRLKGKDGGSEDQKGAVEIHGQTGVGWGLDK